tara:strand:+ start:7678 stop:14217 length:6540 start_codon:yes stop_codon:yes gene_type:complete
MSSNTNLGNTPVSQGYTQLFHTGETGGLTSTLQQVFDGDGTGSDLYLATNKVKIGTAGNFLIGSSTIQEFIQDIVGDMFDTNGSHTNLTATYDDAGDGAIDLVSTGEVTLTGTQTLSNKTLASPIVTGNLVADSIDVAGDLTLDADGADIILKDGGTEYGRLSQLIGGLTLKTGPSASNALIFSADGTTMITGGGVQIPNGSSITLGGHAVNDIDLAGEFVDSDQHLMTSASINDKIGVEIANLVDSAPENLNTLNELASAIGANDNDITTITTALGNRVRIDTASQGLTSTQKSNARTNISVDPAGTDNSTNVTLAGSLDYLTLSGQQITRNAIDLTTDVTGVLPSANLDVDTAHLSGTQTFSGAKTFSASMNLESELNFTGAGNKIIDVETLAGSNNFTIRHHNPSGNLFEDALKLTANAGAQLYYDGSLKLETTSAGAQVRGNAGLFNLIGTDHAYIQYYPDTGAGRKAYVGFGSTSGDTFTIANESSDADIQIVVKDGTSNITAIKIDASAEGRIRLPNDTQQLSIGEDQDLRLYRSSTTSNITNFNDGLTIENAGAGSMVIKNTSNNQDMFFNVVDDNVTKTAIRIDASDSARVKLANYNQRLSLGENNEWEIYHNSTNTLMKNSATGGHFYAMNLHQDKDFYFQVNDGGSTQTALRIQGSTKNLIMPYDDQNLIIGADSDLKLLAHGSAGDVRIEANGKNLLLTRSGVDRFRMNEYGIIINEPGNNLNFRVEGNTDQNLLKVEGNLDRVGIGYGTPAEKFSVNGSILISNNTYFKAYNSAGTAVPLFRLNSSNHIEIINGNSTNGDIIFKDASDTNMTIKGDTGNVGIGLINPSYLLHLSGTAPELAFTDTDGSATWRTRAVTNNFHITETGAGDPFVIQSGAGANAFKILNGGAIKFNDAYTFPTGIGSEKYILTAEGSNVSFFDYNTDVLTATASGDKMIIIDSNDSNNLKIADAPVNVPNVSGTTANGVLTYNSTGGGGSVNVTTESALTFDGTLLHISKETSTTGTTGTTFLKLTNDVGSDLSQQKTFIDFALLDDNSNETPQVRIGAEVGQNGDANSQLREGSGAFVVYTNNADTTSGDAGASLAERMRVDYQGRVGIGVTDPSTKLEVAGHTRISGVGNELSFDTTGTEASNKIKTINDYETLIQNSRGSAGFAVIGNSNIRLGFGNNFTNAETDLFINNNGRIGIGSSSPGSELHIGTGNTARHIKVSDNRSMFGYNGADAIVQGGNTKGIEFHTNTDTFAGSAKMVIEAGGNVGINDASPGHKLDVNGDINTTGSYLMDDSTIIDTNRRIKNINSSVGADLTGGTHRVDFATPATPGSTGWYTICRADSANARGGGIINISATGGSITPVNLTIDFFVDWSGNLNRCNTQGLSGHFTKVRLIETAVTTELQIYVNTSVSQAVYVSFEQDRYNPNYSLLDPWATATPTTTGHEILLRNASVYSNTSNTSAFVVSDNARRLELGRDSIRSTDLSGSTTQLYINSNTTFSGTITTGGNLTMGGAITGITGLYGASSTLTLYNNTYNFKNASSGNMMSLTSTGLGIGTTSPQKHLDITKTGTATFMMKGTGTDNYAGSQLSLFAGTTSNVFNSVMFAMDRRTDGVGGIYLQRRDSSHAFKGTLFSYLDVQGWSFSTASSTTATSTTERMRIDQSGNVGIGTTNPNTLLHLYSTSNTQMRLQTTGTNNASSIVYQNGTASYSVGINSAEQFGFYSSQLSGDAGFINTNGNLYWNRNFLINNNNYGVVARATDGNTRNLIKLDSSNRVQVGDANLAGVHQHYPSTYTQINTDHGYVQIGPQNGSHMHLMTDRTNIYSTSYLNINNATTIQSYNQDFRASRAGSVGDRLEIQTGKSVFQNSLHVEKGLRVDPKTHILNGDGAYHLNVLQYRNNGNISGAFIIDTDIARTSNRMSVIHVHGHGYGQQAVIDFKICLYPYSGHNGPDGNAGSVIAYSMTDNGNDGKRKFVGINSSGNVAIAIDDYNGSAKYFWHFQVDWYNGTSPVNTPTWGVSTSTTDGFGWIQERVIAPPVLAQKTGDQTHNVKVFGSFGVNVNASGTAGRADFANDVVAFSTSDKRLKENVKPLDNALDKISKISGVSFDWKELSEKEKEIIHGNEGHDVGVIAQEIEEVLPEVVTTRDTGYKAVKYEKIVPLLIQAIKEQQQQIEELKNG